VPLNPQQDAVERELPGAEEEQCDCADEEQELELPASFAGEPFMQLHHFEAEIDEDSTGRSWNPPARCDSLPDGPEMIRRVRDRADRDA